VPAITESTDVEAGTDLYLAPVEDKWAYIDGTGKNLTEEPFDEAWSFTEGLGLVRSDDAFGYDDSTGRIVIPLDHIRCHRLGWATRPSVTAVIALATMQ
jgi:hypothetical protein